MVGVWGGVIDWGPGEGEGGVIVAKSDRDRLYAIMDAEARLGKDAAILAGFDMAMYYLDRDIARAEDRVRRLQVQRTGLQADRELRKIRAGEGAGAVAGAVEATK